MQNSVLSNSDIENVSNGVGNIGFLQSEEANFGKELSEYGFDFTKLIQLLSRLPRVDETYVISDLDDCLYSRENQLQSSIIQDNRGDLGNKLIVEKLGGYSEFANKHFHPDMIVKDIMDYVKQYNSMILTA